MYGAEYYAAEYYGAEYYGAGIGPIPEVAGGGGWYHAPKRKKVQSQRQQIEASVRQAFVKDIESEEPELIDPQDILVLLQESRPLLDPALFLPQFDDDKDIEDIVRMLIDKGLI